MATQRNRIVFELGVRRERLDGSFVSKTLAVHPMVVPPATRNSSDVSRSHRQQTTGASLVTRGGRGLREFKFSGTFGVEVRGVGPFIGTGEQRRAMFEREIVRLPDATVRSDLDEVMQATVVSPQLKFHLRALDLLVDVLFLNVYDFWRGISYEGLVRSFDQTKDRRSATGATWYNLTVEEVGPIVHEGATSEALGGLLQGLSALDEVVAVISAFNLSDVVENLATGVTEIPIAALESVFTSTQAQVRGIKGLVRGVSRPLPGVFNATDGIRQKLAELRRATRPAPRGSGLGVPTWDGDQTARSYEQGGEIHDVEEALRQLPFLGGFFGLSDPDWSTLLSGSGRRETRGQRTYRVSPLDSGASIERSLGIRWSAILDLNGLLPDEALVPGTELRIPGLEPAITPEPIVGLPVLDSHANEGAWGSDLAFDLRTADGDVVVLTGAECLNQGVDLLVFEYGSQILEGTDRVPGEYQSDWIRDRLIAILGSDPRVSGVGAVSMDTQGTGIAFEATVFAINGATVTVS